MPKTRFEHSTCTLNYLKGNGEMHNNLQACCVEQSLHSLILTRPTLLRRDWSRSSHSSGRWLLLCDLTWIRSCAGWSLAGLQRSVVRVDSTLLCLALRSARTAGARGTVMFHSVEAGAAQLAKSVAEGVSAWQQTSGNQQGTCTPQ